MTEGDSATDELLIARIAAGDQRAFRALFTSYGERVFRYAYRVVSDNAKAEEVTNDVMLEVWKHAARFEGRSKVSTWILGIARHVALNAVRNKQLDTVDLDTASPAADEEPRDTAEQAHDRRLLKQGVREVLARLSPEHRDVVELTFFHGRSYDEIAKIVGCPENTVKTRMFHARRQIREMLTRRGLDPTMLEIAS